MGVGKDIGFVACVRCCGNCRFADHVSGIADVQGCEKHPELDGVVDTFSACSEHELELSEDEYEDILDNMDPDSLQKYEDALRRIFELASGKEHEN